jgi:3-deoxy-7-phosphoheptulonate synthase
VIGNATLTRPTPLHAAPAERTLDYWRTLPAAQQPAWADEWLVDRVRSELAAAPSLVAWADVDALRRLLAEVAAGRMLVVQAGDCAEDPAECEPTALSRKAGLLDALAGVMRLRTGRPVVRAGRLAGQFAKPRTRHIETVDGVDLPAFRGLMISGAEPDPLSRRPDPLRMLSCYRAAAAAMDYLWRASSWRPRPHGPVWTSHEALVLDYELPQVRHLSGGRLMLGSTHWPWIGDRTRQLDGAHVRLFSAISNPVACKVGPGMSPDSLRELCAVLDPDREPGRLTLIARLGADLAAQRLPDLVAAVRAAGHPVIWLCDPMHGNTVTAPDGRKTRRVDTIACEVRDFQEAVTAAGGVAGGLHLETTPHAVTECVADAGELDRHRPDETYTTLCDPRLNPEQALAVVANWTSSPHTR